MSKQILGLVDDKPQLKIWIEAFRQWSHHNDIYGILCFHIMMGIALKDTKIMKGGSYIDPRINVFLLQGSSSGKSEGYNFLAKIADQMKIKVDDKVDLTDASLIGTIDEEELYDKETGTKSKNYIINPGTLKDAQLVYFDEASTLLKETQFKQNVIIYFQKAMNPIGSPSNLLSKDLRHGTVEFNPSPSFLFNTYEPANIKDIALNTGFFQRCLTFPRHLSREDRELMDKNDTESYFSKKADVNFVEIAEMFTGAREKYNNKQVKLSEFSIALKKVIDNKKATFRKLAENSSHSIRMLMDGFIPRYSNMMVVLAYHSMVMRGDDKINTQDIVYGHCIVFELFKNLVNWFETDVEVTEPIKVKKAERIVKTIKNIIKEAPETIPKNGQGMMLVSDLTKEISEDLRMSYPTASKYIRQALEDNKNGNIQISEISKNKVYVKWRGN